MTQISIGKIKSVRALLFSIKPPHTFLHTKKHPETDNFKV